MNIVTYYRLKMSKIFRFGKSVDDVFQDIFLVVVVFSLPILVATLYPVSLEKKLDLGCIPSLGGLFTTSTELFITCYYGNEITFNVNLRSSFFLCS